MIHCIGDSHTSFFSGSNRIQPIWPKESNNKIPLFRTYHIGPTLAYNLCNSGTHTNGREKLFKIIEGINKNDFVLLSFGEIDCRVHIAKQAYLQNKSIDDIIKECVKRYFSVILKIKDFGYKIILWGVIPTSPSEEPLNTEISFIWYLRGTKSYNAVV